MILRKLALSVIIILATIAMLPAAPVISEFMAINNSSLADENGDFSDWIEIHNPDANAVNLSGWHLTDDNTSLTKWTFPNVTIPSGDYLVVFASDKNRSNPDFELHTNFKLSGGGEFLALVMPDGTTLASSFSPYPPQVTDVAYGLSFTPQNTAVLATGAQASVHVPDATTGPALGDQWIQLAYTESSQGETWTSAQSGVGFGSSFSSLIGTGGDLETEMLNIQPGAYLRAEFQVSNLDDIDAMTLRMKYDDGFVAYLNGEEIARANTSTEGSGAPASGLVALYDFDGDLDDDADEYTNGSGVSADDLTPTGTAAYQPGIAGQAVNITAAGLQRLRAVDSDDLDLAPNWTLEAFVRPDSSNSGEWDRFWTKWGDGGQDWHWAFRGSNNGLDLFVNGSDNILNHNSTASVPLNTWSHVALVGNQSANTITAWFNGTQVGSTTWRAIAGSSGAMNFGNFASPSSSFQFSGLIDEAAIWSVALSPAQLASHAAAINGSPMNSAEAYGLTPNGSSGTLDWQSTALSERNNPDALNFVDIDLTSRVDLLQPGNNLLAIHGLNSTANADHFLILPEVNVTALTANLGTEGYLTNTSPGMANPASTASIGPIISTVEHTPLVPQTSESITVTAGVIETLEPVDTLSLTYRVNFGSETTIPMTGDGMGNYSATIPSSAFSAGDMVRWNITANDTSNNTTQFPPFPDPIASPEYLGTVVSDPSTTSALPILHWFLQNPSAAETGSGTRASLFYNGEFYDNAFVRIRGDTARNWPKKSYKFDFNDGHNFRFDPMLPRVDEINVNTTYTDKSYSRTIIAYETFRDSGSPYSIAFPLRMEQNGSFYSVAHFVEQPDRDYLRRNDLDDDGAFYKVTGNSIQGVSSFFGPATSGVEKKTRREEDFSDLQSLIDSLALNGDPLNDYLFDNVDIPAVVNNLAANVVIQNIDRTVKNFYLYRDTEGSGEWKILPWDVDLSFGPNALNTNVVVTSEDSGNNSSHPFMGTQAEGYTGLWNGLIDAVIDRPDTREMFLRRVRTLGDRFLNSTYYEDRLGELETAMTPDVLLDRNRWGSSAHFGGTTLSLQGEIDKIRNNYLPGRRSHLFSFHTISNGGGTGLVLLPEATQVTAWVPTNGTLGNTWQLNGFDDSTWLSGTNAVGYERSGVGGYTPLLGIDLLSSSIPAFQRIDINGDGVNENSSCFLRYEFNVADKDAIEFLKLRVKYDDGFVAYLNGTQIGSRNAPASPIWDSQAASQNSDGSAVQFEDLDVSSFKNQLLNGANILAIHALNFGTESSDMLFSCTLVDEEAGGSDLGVGIATSQPPTPAINFGQIEYNPSSGNQNEEFIELTNPNSFAVDVSGWQIEEGVNITLAPGTVITAGGSLFLSPDSVTFRNRSASPTGGQGRFIQGNYSGKLSNFGEDLILKNAAGDLINNIATPNDPSDAQLFLVVSEFHYHPAGDPGEEFIELTNISTSETLSLNGVRFTSGVIFNFTGTLAPGARILVVRDQAAFEARYGMGFPVVGEFETMTNLDNDGETIKLEDATNSTIQEFTYNDKAPWPVIADGGGASLVLINPTARPDHDNASNWRPSALPDGNPGTTDAIAYSGNTAEDLIAHALFGGSLPKLIVGADTLRFQFDRNLAADDVSITISVSTDLETWDDESNTFMLETSNYPGDGSQRLTFIANNAALPDDKFFVRLNITLNP